MSDQQARRPGERLARKDEVRRLLARRFTQAQIAEQLGISQPAVSKWLRQIELDAKAAVADRAAEIRTMLDTYAEVEREAWLAWEASKGEVQTRTHAIGFEAKGAVDLTTTKTEHLNGNPAYLNVVLGCQAQRRSLLGLDAPTKAQEFIVAELNAGLERLRANLPPALFQQVAGLLAGRAGDAVLIDGDGTELALDG